MALSVGDPDGFGRYGIADETVDGLLCHDCGHHYAHLGLHAYRAHGTTADEYRAAHGLGRAGLVIEATRVTITDNARRALPGKAAFLAARDPTAASQAQRRGSEAISAAGMHAIRVSARTRKGRTRKGTVVVCGWCGAQFCPLLNALKRKYCTRSCAGRAARNPAQANPCKSPPLAPVEDELRAAVPAARDADDLPGPSSAQPWHHPTGSTATIQDQLI